MEFLKKLFIHSPLDYIIALVVSFAVFFEYLFFNGFDKGYNYLEAAFVSGFIVVLYGGLKTVIYYGAFDTFGYGFAKMFGNKAKYVDLIDYNERKKAKRVKLNYPFIPYFVVGSLVLLIAFTIKLFV